MAGAPLRIGPLPMTTGVSVLYQPGYCSGGVNSTNTTGSGFPGMYGIITHIRLINTVTGGNAQAGLWIGPSSSPSAGQEFGFSYQSIPNTTNATCCCPNYVDWYGRVPVYQLDYLTGQTTVAGVTFQAEGEQYLSVG